MKFLIATVSMLLLIPMTLVAQHKPDNVKIKTDAIVTMAEGIFLGEAFYLANAGSSAIKATKDLGPQSAALLAAMGSEMAAIAILKVATVGGTFLVACDITGRIVYSSKGQDYGDFACDNIMKDGWEIIKDPKGVASVIFDRSSPAKLTLSLKDIYESLKKGGRLQKVSGHEETYLEFAKRLSKGNLKVVAALAKAELEPHNHKDVAQPQTVQQGE